MKTDTKGNSGPDTNNISFRNITSRMNDLYARKNQDYGDSFHQTYLEEGMAMPRIRLTDKMNRFKRLTFSEAKVENESIIDTLTDMACYAVMTIMELERENDGT